jgi:DNA-binding NarL/FixJ family response regulator
MVEPEVESRTPGNDSLIIARIGAAKGIREESAIEPVVANAHPSQHTPVRVADASRRTLVIIERRVLIRECLVRCLKDSASYDVIGSFSTVEEWLKERHHASLRPVIVLCPAERTEVEVERDVALLSRAAADISVVILSDREDPGSVFRALDKGVRGYITTSMAFDVAVQAIHLVRAGGTFVPACTLIASRDSIEKLPTASEKPRRGLFTARQLAVVDSLRQGKANKVIAHELNMCESTVKVHVRNIMKKLRAKNRTEVVFLMRGVEGEGKANQGDVGSAKAQPYD